MFSAVVLYPLALTAEHNGRVCNSGVLTSVAYYDASISNTRAEKIAYVMIWKTKYYSHDQMRRKGNCGARRTHGRNGKRKQYFCPIN
jgi:hypothetical protein